MKGNRINDTTKQQEKETNKKKVGGLRKHLIYKERVKGNSER